MSDAILPPESPGLPDTAPDEPLAPYPDEPLAPAPDEPGFPDPEEPNDSLD